MKNLFKNKVVSIIILLATLILAGVAVFTAIRLFQLRQESVAPNVPTSRPAADEIVAPTGSPNTQCISLGFVLNTDSTPPSAPPSAPASGTPTPTPTPPASCNNSCNTNSDCNTGLVCSNGSCKNASCTADSDCVCATATPTPSSGGGTTTTTVTATPTPTLPEAGVGTPTIVGAGLGILLILGALLLAL